MAKEQQRFIDLLPQAEYLENHLNGLGWVKVTYCKDCKHKNKYGYCTLYLNFHHLTADMDYCSDAERKEE